MTITSEKNLSYFKWWSGAALNAEQLTDKELDQLDDILTELYPDGIDETQLNDIMWFDFDWVLECLGLELDDNGDVIR